MARYIDAEKLLNRMKQDPLFPLVERYGVSGVIEAEPTADVVEVVRCKDCVWYDKKRPYNGSNMLYMCRNLQGYFPPDFFCKDGERRDDVRKSD